MSEFDNKGIPLPEKEDGAQKEFIAKEETATIEEARQLFETAKKRLLHINNWDKVCGKASAKFELKNENGVYVAGEPKPGDHFQIDIPAPGNKTGKGFDWVRVEAIEEDNDISEDREFIVIRVRPSSNPAEANDETAHFLSEKSTSNFLVMREKNLVTAAVIGRNEQPNTSTPQSLFDKIRNMLVGTGAVAGLAYPQWKSLVNGLLEKD